jgi:HK97 family phage major capsid protein
LLNYQLYGFPVRVYQSLANAKAAFCALRKYRCWRRKGYEVESTDQGKTLRTTNMMLLTLRGRYAGKVVDPNGFCIGQQYQE